MTGCRFEITHRSGGARRGRLQLPHGIVETPAFMPVGTRAAVKGVTVDQLHALGAEILLANTYHLHLRPGDELIARAGGLHAFMGWDGPLLDRLRGLPGLQSCRSAHARRTGRDLPFASRRPAARAVAGIRSRHPGAARSRHRDDVRRMHVLARDARRGRGVDAPHAAMGAPRARSVPCARRRVDGRRVANDRRPGPVRHRARRHVHRSSRRERRRHA